MKARYWGALFCVILMVVSPVLAVTSDGDVSDDTATAADVKITNIGKEGVDEIFNTKTPNLTELIIYDATQWSLGINTELQGSINSSEYNSFSYEMGERKNVSDGSTSISRYEIINADFTLSLKNESFPMPFLDKQCAFKGEAVNQLVFRYGTKMFNENDVIRIEGTVNFTTLFEDKYSDRFTGKDGDGYYKNVSKSKEGKVVYDLDVYFNDAFLFNDKADIYLMQSESNSFEVIGEESEFTSDTYGLMTATEKMVRKCTGTKNFGSDSYNYEPATGPTEKVVGPCASPLKQFHDNGECHYYDSIMFFDNTDETAISNNVAKYNGITKKNDLSMFEKGYSKVKDEIKTDVTLIFQVNDFRYGRLSTDTITVDKGTTITYDGNTLKAGDKTVFAYPSDSKDGCRYELKTWGIDNNKVVNDDMTILVEFKEVRNENPNTPYIAAIVILAVLLIVICAYVIYSRRA